MGGWCWRVMGYIYLWDVRLLSWYFLSELYSYKISHFLKKVIVIPWIFFNFRSWEFLLNFRHLSYLRERFTCWEFRIWPDIISFVILPALLNVPLVFFFLFIQFLLQINTHSLLFLLSLVERGKLLYTRTWWYFFPSLCAICWCVPYLSARYPQPNLAARSTY